MKVRILSEVEIRSLITQEEALGSARSAYTGLARGDLHLPAVMDFEFPEHDGEVHGKGGHVKGSPYFSIKVAGGYNSNPKLGLPAIIGAVFVFDAKTGFLIANLLDNGYLTELRTGAAGAVATDLLARKNIDTLSILGSGGQARYQLATHLQVRKPKRVLVYSRNESNARRYADEMSKLHSVSVAVADSAEALTKAADVLVTTTPARAAVVLSEWVKPGTHITALGSDMAGKQELEAKLLARAKVFADSRLQAAKQGEVQHALKEGLFALESVTELGEVLIGAKPGRTSDEDITIADQTGVGALDAAVANLVTTKAVEKNIGFVLER